MKDINYQMLKEVVLQKNKQKPDHFNGKNKYLDF